MLHFKMRETDNRAIGLIFLPALSHLLRSFPPKSVLFSPSVWVYWKKDDIVTDFVKVTSASYCGGSLF